MNDRFSPLDSGEVISIAANDSQPGTIHRADMLTQTLAAKFQELCAEHPELAMAWLGERGINAEVLKYGAAGWQSGKLRIAIEFCPDPVAEAAAQEITTSPTAVTATTPTPIEPVAIETPAWADSDDGDEELLLEPLSTPLSIADNYSAAAIETFAQRCQGQIEASPAPMADVADVANFSSNGNDFSDPLATLAIDLTNFELPGSNNDASFDAALETIDIDLDQFDIGAIGGNSFTHHNSIADPSTSPENSSADRVWEDVVPPLDFLSSEESSAIEDIADLDVSAELESMNIDSSIRDSSSLSAEAFSDFAEVFETGDLSSDNLPPAAIESNGFNLVSEDAFDANFDDFGTAVIDEEDLAFGTFAEPEGIDVKPFTATANPIATNPDEDLDDFGTAVFDEDDLAFGTFAIDESISLNMDDFKGDRDYLSFDSLEMIATPKSPPLLDNDIAKSLDDLPPLDEIWQAKDRVSWP